MLTSPPPPPSSRHLLPSESGQVARRSTAASAEEKTLSFKRLREQFENLPADTGADQNVNSSNALPRGTQPGAAATRRTELGTQRPGPGAMDDLVPNAERVRETYLVADEPPMKHSQHARRTKTAPKNGMRGARSRVPTSVSAKDFRASQEHKERTAVPVGARVAAANAQEASRRAAPARVEQRAPPVHKTHTAEKTQRPAANKPEEKATGPAPSPTTSGQVELARYLQQNSPIPPQQAKPPTSDRKANTACGAAPKTANSISSLIEQFSGKAPASLPNQEPLSESALERVAGLPVSRQDGAADNEPDTFCDSTLDLGERHPKTDPGQLESYARQHSKRAQYVQPGTAHAPSFGEHAAPGNIAVGGVPKRETPAATFDEAVQRPMFVTSVSASGGFAGASSAIVEPAEGDPDWGGAHLHLQELFAEAETTAEKAVQCDENEDYYDAFSLYCNVVELYYKVIPFLNAEEGEDVNQRIKMYTRRCEAIREAFENDDVGLEDEIEVDLPEVRADPPRVAQTVPLHGTLDDAEPYEDELTDVPADAHASEMLARPNVEDRVAPLTNHLPDATRGLPTHGMYSAGAPGVAAAHRNRLSRPISRRSVREAATTNSVSRAKVAEMQERVQVMQACLNNFTVKRKHLGPARALELQITTLNANTFGELKRLEPLPTKLEHMWATELEVLLSMLQEIKESRPGQMNVLREDIAKHLPSLQRCDNIVRNSLRSFSRLVGHVDYVERETAGDGGAGGPASQRKWWIKVPVVRDGGLATDVRALVEDVEQEMRMVFKVCHEINVEVVKLMPVPNSFFDALPKKSSKIISAELREGLMTWPMFKISDYMKDRGIWNRESAKEITSNLEKVALVWEAKTANKSFISRTFDMRGERFHQAVTAFRRCQNAIRDLRRDWPTMKHTDLDMAKIEKNEDIGLAGLEAYSRAVESRAARLLERIRELLKADDVAAGRSGGGKRRPRPALG